MFLFFSVIFFLSSLLLPATSTSGSA